MHQQTLTQGRASSVARAQAVIKGSILRSLWLPSDYIRLCHTTRPNPTSHMHSLYVL